MGIFATTTPETDDTPTTGSTNKLLIALIAILAFITAPITITTFLILVITGERRRVRQSRWIATTATATLISISAAMFNLDRWLGWFFTGSLVIWGNLANPHSRIGIIATIGQAAHDHTPTQLLAHHLITGIPTALAMMCLWWWYRSYALKLRGENEGEAYTNIRPIGRMDQRRQTRAIDQVTTGAWSKNNPGHIAVGVGRYGGVAAANMDDFKKTTLVVGTSRSGKTREANSLAAQQVIEMGAGNICIDLKGDLEFAAAKAELAHQRGVPFLHFTIPEPGTDYRQPHPYAPKWPATYDPLSRGSGGSKAAMLLDSVPRENDAAYYARLARDMVKTAYDVAALTGFDRGKNEAGFPHSGLKVLSLMLNTDNLISMGKSVTVDQVMRYNSFLSQAAATERVQEIHHRITELESELNNPKSARHEVINDIRTTISTFANDQAVGALLAPGTRPALRIDLVRAILRGEIVVFSLPAQKDRDTAVLISTLVLLDLQNAVATLRDNQELLEEYFHQETPGHGGLDANAWNPVVLQMEEINELHSPVAARAMLGLFNKSADAGIRPIVSTQSLADVTAVDGTGVFLKQLMAQLDHLITLQLTEPTDAKMVSDFSGEVTKKIPTEHAAVSNNRTGLFQSMASAGKVIGRPEEQPRIKAGEPLALGRVDAHNLGEMLWVKKVPALSAVHTIGPEGPNNWSETLYLTPVHEQPKGWKPFGDIDHIHQAQDHRDEVFRQLVDDLQHNRGLWEVTVGLNARNAMNTQAATPASGLADLPSPQDEDKEHETHDMVANDLVPDEHRTPQNTYLHHPTTSTDWQETPNPQTPSTQIEDEYDPNL